MTAVQAVGRCMGWQLLASSSHLGSGPVEPLGNASSCLLASPNGRLPVERWNVGTQQYKPHNLSQEISWFQPT